MTENPATRINVWHRISTLLFLVLTMIAAFFGFGLLLLTFRLFEIRGELDVLQAQSLPVLIRLSQLSQDASATSSIATALGQAATRSEFDTLVARIHDKQASQSTLIDELEDLSGDPERVATLRLNAAMLSANLERLMDAVENQIDLRRQFEDHIEGFSQYLTALRGAESEADPKVLEMATRAVSQVERFMQDTNRARLARNHRAADDSVEVLARHLAGRERAAPEEKQEGAPEDLVTSWVKLREDIVNAKSLQLSNAFQIKALVEENSLIANRLLSSASNSFWRARTELETQVKLVNETTRFTLFTIFGLLLALVAASVLVSQVLRRRVFLRLERLMQALKGYSENRQHGISEDRPDEIGAIFGAMAHYMDVIDQRETELDEKTTALEGLANQLAKYLSPQVYNSIFTGKQEVKLVSSRKKLTVFFSDIVGFTETADRLESEELTRLLNHYLTEMSRIAFAHGATIDKYVGDAILVFFGDPETRGVGEDALACVRMAMDMRSRMKELRHQWHRSGIEKPLQVRMGIHTGYCTVGNFGSDDRMDYTIIGGAVNIASRLQTMAAPGEILVSYETFAIVQDQVECSEFGDIDVKGIAYPVAAFVVLDPQDESRWAPQNLHEHQSHFRLDLDLSEMSEKDRAAAAASLRKGLSLLE